MFFTFWALGLSEAEQALAVRREVFMDELGLEEKDVFDENDAISAHLIVVLDGDIPIASSRMYPYNGAVMIDKPCVKREYRGQAFGDLLTRVMLDKAQKMGTPKIFARVQDEYREYYRSFGFTCEGELMSVEPEKIDWHPACRG